MTRTLSSMNQTWNLGEHELNPEQRNEYLRAQLQAFSLGEEDIRLGVVQAALRGCGYTDMPTVAEVFKNSCNLPTGSKTVKIDDFIEAFSQHATPLGPEDTFSTTTTAPWDRDGDHGEHIGFVQLQSYLQSTAADSAIPKRPSAVQKATVRTPRKLSFTSQEKIVEAGLENELTTLNAQLAIAVGNQDFERAAALKRDIDAKAAELKTNNVTIRQYPFSAVLTDAERTALESKAHGSVRIDLLDATTLVLSHFREAILRSTLGANALAKLRQVLKAIDTDGSGELDELELQTRLKEFGIELSKHDLKLLFAACDTNGSGTIEVDDFLQAVRGDVSTRRRRLIIEAFKRLDRNGDGELRIDYLRKM